jgi:hypothetical protein
MQETDTSSDISNCMRMLAKQLWHFSQSMVVGNGGSEMHIRHFGPKGDTRSRAPWKRRIPAKQQNKPLNTPVRILICDKSCFGRGTALCGVLVSTPSSASRN